MSSIDLESPHLTIIGLADVASRLDGVGGRISDMRPVMEGAIRAILLRSAQENFQSEGRPDPWPDIKAKTRKRRRGTDLILQDTQELLRSLSPEGNRWSVREADESSSSVGTNRPGARNHQEGITVPERRFLIAHEEDVEDIKTVIADFAIGRMGEL